MRRAGAFAMLVWGGATSFSLPAYSGDLYTCYEPLGTVFRSEPCPEGVESRKDEFLTVHYAVRAAAYNCGANGDRRCAKGDKGGQPAVSETPVVASGGVGHLELVKSVAEEPYRGAVQSSDPNKVGPDNRKPRPSLMGGRK